MFKPKVAKRNFKEEDLPSTRKEVFFDRFKIQYKVIFKVGLVLLVFCLPFMFCKGFEGFLIYSNYQNEAFSEVQYHQTKVIFSFVNIFTLLIASVGFAGVNRIIKNLAWETPVFFKEDFKEGVKKNSKQYMELFLFFAICNCFVKISKSTLNVPDFLRYIPAGILIGIIVPTTMFALNVFNLYNAKFFEGLKLSIRFYFLKFFKNIGVIFCLLIPFFNLLLGNFIIQFFIFFISFLFIIPPFLLIWFLYSCYIFDEFMNKKNYPEIVDKGIHRNNKGHN